MATGTLAPTPARPGPDFRRLWLATAVSQAGTAIGTGALPLVAVLVLHVPTFQVSLLAALSGLVAAVLGLRLGPWVEFRRKRPTMVGADLVRFAALASVPAAAALGLLSYAQLCLVGICSATADLVFTAASGAHLKALVHDDARLVAASRLETTFWTTNSVGPPIGGALMSLVGLTLTMLLDALSYLGSALGVRSLRRPEPPPPARIPSRWAEDVTAGWRTIWAHPGLRALFLNAMLFGGCIIAVSPLLTVFMLRDLGLPPWAYGVAMGVPCLGGLLGAACVPGLARLFGERVVLLGAGVLRTCWMPLLALAPAGYAGFALITVAEFGLLFSAGVFNPTFSTYRLRVTPEDRLARVTAAWSVTNKVAQPLGVLAAGALAAATGPRLAIATAAGVLLASGALLPWRRFSAL